MKGPSSQLRLLPPEAYPSPVTEWSNQLVPPESLLETTLDVSHFSPGPCYEPFGGHSDVSVSPLSYYSPQTLHAPSSYGSAFDFGGGPGTLSAPSSRFWPNTPHSDATSSEIQALVKEEPDECWDHHLLTKASSPTGLATLPQMSQAVGDDIFPNPQRPDNDNGTLVELNLNVGCYGDNSRKAAAQNMPIEMVFKLTKSDSELPDEQCKILSASGLQCTICGSRFTRRSNCREHMKRHDPNLRKSYHCEFIMEYENSAVSTAASGLVDMTHSRGTRQTAATENLEIWISPERWKRFKHLSTSLIPRSKILPTETNDDNPYRSISCMPGTVTENNKLHIEPLLR
ncbi:hypothetical protein ETB97_006684 [Aspergillus alliaceus]|uniref:C2H2-type domain-containing protein n=1 Tax=Petromyces alliaceus TaxID=209559 RepID=A0A8H5ZV08_PETAA|nr:hypothetical protein ETB97_006684 [Aspergillus burnettii]